jgi:peptidoglycan/xylan/chitin deacetylase (PgdA/CDA1 family)
MKAASASFALALSLAFAAGFPSSAGEPKKRIAFTYDDGPMEDGPLFSGVERTALLIDALKVGGVEQAAFFMTTRRLTDDSRLQRVRDYAAAGHVIANHSHQHEWAHKMTSADYLADIDMAEEKLSVFENRRAWFRFPYLDEGREAGKRDAIRTGLAERGLMSGYVTVDTFDWHMVNLARQAVDSGLCVNRELAGDIYVEIFVDAAEHFHGLALETLGRAPAQVILLHENDFAALYADDLAKALRMKGWEIITADEAFADPLATQLPKTLFSGQGRIAALASEAGIPHDRIDHDASEEGPINARFESAGVFRACDLEPSP